VRVTDRIEAENFDKALEERQRRKNQLRENKEGSHSGELVFDLTEVFKMLMKKIENQVELEAVGEKQFLILGLVFKDSFLTIQSIWVLIGKQPKTLTAKDFDDYQNYYGITLGRKQGLSSEMRTLRGSFHT